MNVKDFNIEIPEGDMLELIFNHQYHLMEKYHVIEQKNLSRRLPDPNSLDLDSVDGQLRLKEFAWRITEELAESTECLVDGVQPDGDSIIHFLEELVDALHFSIEFNMMSRVFPDDIVKKSLMGAPLEDKLMQLEDEYHLRFGQRVNPNHYGLKNYVNNFKMYTWFSIELLGRAMNTLKNKPWKNTHMVTDRAEYHRLVVDFNHKLFDLMWLAGFTAKSLTQMYLNKNAVNKFRIASNY